MHPRFHDLSLQCQNFIFFTESASSESNILISVDAQSVPLTRSTIDLENFRDFFFKEPEFRLLVELPRVVRDAQGRVVVQGRASRRQRWATSRRCLSSGRFFSI